MKNFFRGIRPIEWVFLALGVVGVVSLFIGLFALVLQVQDNNRQKDKAVELGEEAGYYFGEGLYEKAAAKYEEIRQLPTIGKETNPDWYYWSIYSQALCYINLAEEDNELTKDYVLEAKVLLKMIVDDGKENEIYGVSAYKVYRYLGWAYYKLSRVSAEFEEKEAYLIKARDAYEYARDIVKEGDKFSDELPRLERSIELIKDDLEALREEQPVEITIP